MDLLLVDIVSEQFLNGAPPVIDEFHQWYCLLGGSTVYKLPESISCECVSVAPPMSCACVLAVPHKDGVDNPHTPYSTE